MTACHKWFRVSGADAIEPGSIPYFSFVFSCSVSTSSRAQLYQREIVMPTFLSTLRPAEKASTHEKNNQSTY